MHQSHALARIARELSQLVGQRNETLADGIARYRATRVNEHNLRPSTIIEYERALARLEADLGHLPVQAIGTEEVSGHLGTVAPTILPSHFSVVSACLRWLDRRGCPGLAAALPERRPRRRPYTQCLSDAEYQALWTGFDTAQRNRWARPVVIDLLRFLTLVPLRRGEAVSLRWDELDVDGGRILLHDAKTGDRIVPVGPLALSIALRQRRTTSVYVFAGQRGGTLHGSSVHHAWARILQRLSMRPLRLHGLRHSWASREVREGTPLEVVRRVMGHSTEWMSSRYAHLGADAARDAVERMERAIATPNPSAPTASVRQLELPFGFGGEA